MPLLKFFRYTIASSAMLVLALLHTPLSAQADGDLEAAIMAQDTKLFDIGFNQCNFEVWNTIFGQNFEFYDDRSGLNTNRELEVRSFNERCEKAPDLKRRLLSSQVSPLGDDFALQMGVHEFVIDDSVVERAKFVHIWEWMDGTWIVSRVISYDHRKVND